MLKILNEHERLIYLEFKNAQCTFYNFEYLVLEMAVWTGDESREGGVGENRRKFFKHKNLIWIDLCREQVGFALFFFKHVYPQF